MKNNLSVLLLFFVLIACNNNENIISEKTDTIVYLPQITATEIDTIVYDTVTFPRLDELKSKMLTEGSFHNDEVWETAKKENWLGLFYNSNEVYVDSTRIYVNSVFDEILDDEGGKKTGWEVTAKHIDTAIIFVQNTNISPKRNIEQIKLNKKYLFPEDSFDFEYNGIKYTLYAKGGKKKEDPNSDWYIVWNYKLYIKTSTNGNIKETLLCAETNFDDQMITIDFIGDIDGDNIPDLIINTSRHYNADCPTLYLSKPAKGKDIVKPVGYHLSIGC